MEKTFYIYCRSAQVSYRFENDQSFWFIEIDANHEISIDANIYDLVILDYGIKVIERD